MATTPQIKMLCARAAEAGVKASWDQFVDLNNGQIDEKLAEYESLKRGEMVGDGAYKPAKKDDMNSQRFGMCCKLCLQKYGLDWAIKERAQFASQVLSVYRSCEAAEKVVRAAPLDLS